MANLNPVKVALSSRIALLIIQIAFIGIGSKYDSSSFSQSVLSRNIREDKKKEFTVLNLDENHTLLDKFVLNSLSGFGNWDSVFFLHVSYFGYEYEQFMAFFPLLPALLSKIADFVSVISYSLLGRLASMYLVSCLMNIAIFSLAASFLHKLTCNAKGPTIGNIAVLLFCTNPANVFNMATYTESLYVCLQLMAMYYLESSNCPSRYLKAGVLFSLGSFTRSNGILSAGFLLCMAVRDVLQLLIKVDKSTNSWKLKETIVIQRVIGVILASGIGVVLTLASFVLFQMYGYALYCLKSASITTEDKDHWCQKTIPFSYNYVQNFYWNVGPFQYYEVKQIPNFFLAFPTILLSYSAVWSYFAANGGTAGLIEYLCTEDQAENRLSHQGNDAKAYQTARVFPYACHLAFLVTFGLVNIHVQVLTRMIFSSTPFIYWFAAKILLNSTYLTENIVL
eukprot:gene16572-18257_t